jgi:hypothetical protein
MEGMEDGVEGGVGAAKVGVTPRLFTLSTVPYFLSMRSPPFPR